ncbi:aldehyde dehydrogenase family protein [Actinomycetospora sp. NBC_00405]|uniref:aldehyde dehydrogenase family protein n=1 Tax=Actinomycetospora sp. NBC_00405 TaxID=2975952 RepID=UPI002E2129A5
MLDDASLDLAAIGNDLPVATLANNGQTCFLGTRVLAPRSRYDKVVDVFTAFAESTAIGDSLDPGTQIGPMSSDPARPSRATPWRWSGSGASASTPSRVRQPLTPST